MKFRESLKELSDDALLYTFRKVRESIRRSSVNYCSAEGLTDADIRKLAILQKKRSEVTSEMLNRISIPLTAVYEEGSYEDV